MRAAVRTGPASRSVSTRRREDGAIAVMFAGSLLVIFGFMGLALDLSMLYNRKVEMQNVANTVALAAAGELNGTAAGITQALRRASERFVTLPGTVVGGMSYQYSTRTMDWSDAAIEFGPTPTGPWVSAGAALAQPARMLFARVDTRGLNPEYGEVSTLFIRVLNPDLGMVSTSGRAVAGRTAINVTPMGICAMRSDAAWDHAGELEEYGFRRGVSYDLMQLNPDSTAAGATYLINPFVAPGTPGIVQPASTDSVKPFVCTGSMAMSRVTGGDVVVSTPFPLSDMYEAFNSRFDMHTPPCRPETAPPDANVKQYTFDDTNAVPWMDTAPGGQAAAVLLTEGKRWTVVGPLTTPTGTTAGMYGPLWSYAKAVRYAASEPATGYTAFASGDWSTLYSQGKPKAKSYPGTPPYSQTGAAYAKKPDNTGVRGRRVLNIPLLSCPVTGDRARVLGIGKFFMTVPAKTNALYGEFGGLASEQTLGSRVRLY